MSPLAQTSWRDLLQKTVRPEASVCASVSAFIHAIISTWPSAWSCTMAGTRPASSNFTRPSSSADALMGVIAGIGPS